MSFHLRTMTAQAILCLPLNLPHIHAIFNRDEKKKCFISPHMSACKIVRTPALMSFLFTLLDGDSKQQVSLVQAASICCVRFQGTQS